MSSGAAGGRPASSGKGVAIQGLKLPFHVTFASSYDDGYEPTQLEQAAQAAAKAAAAAGNPHASAEEKQVTPHIKGWQSAKYCPYPQTLVLQFPHYFDIRKIQILSHQAKIANTIEIYAGVSPALSDIDDSQANYSRLGYLSLDSNERSGFKARELKSVYVNARGNFLKLIIKKCYSNHINQYNQVGIIAINVVGTKAPDQQPQQQLTEEVVPSSSVNHTGGAVTGAAPGQAGGLNVHNANPHAVIASLITQYNCDEKTASKIYELEKAKSRAIAEEDYDLAKKLKVHLDSLKELGGRLAQLEREKVAAVANEDYDLAKQIKKEIDYLRGRAAAPVKAQQPPPQQNNGYNQQLSRATSQKSLHQQHQQQHHHDPYQQDLHHQHHQQQEDPYYQQQLQNQHHQQDNYDNQPIHAAQHYQQQQQHQQPHEDHNGYGAGASPMEDPHQQQDDQIPPQNQEEEYHGDPEDRPIRPSRHAQQAMMDDENGPPRQTTQPAAYPDSTEGEEAPSDPSAVPPPEALSAVNRKDAEPLIDVFGDHTVMCLYSKHWVLRQQAIKDITQSVLDNSNDLPVKELFALSCRVLRRGLSDKVSQIFLSACQFLQVLLKHLAMRLKPEDVKSLLDPIVVAMMEKLSSSNVRERDGGMQVLTFLAFDSHVHPSLVPSNLLQPLKKKEKDSPLPLKTRAKILLKCVIFYGLDDSFSLSLGSLTKFVLPHLLHRDAGVREGMFNLVAGMSSIIGVQKLMPAFKDLRPQTLESLQAKLDDVASGALVFLKPAQPSLEGPYISENDPTHTLNGVPQSSIGAGVSAPQPGPPVAQPQRQAKQSPQPASSSSSSSQPRQAQNKQGQQQQQRGGNQKQQQGHQQRSQAQHPVAEAVPEEEQSIDLQGKCQFCGLEDPTFTEEKLDLHYWADCPILISCKQCEQVIEIPTLNEHLLHECEVTGGYKECPTCYEPVLASAYSAHVERADCRPPAAGMARCALCHADVVKGDEGWKNHLLVETCPKNIRQVKK